MSRRLALSLLGVVVLFTTATDTTFSILDVLSLLAARDFLVALPIAASTLDVLSLCCVALFSMQVAWKRDGIVQMSVRARRVLAGCCILNSAIALMVSMTSIIVIKTRSNEINSATSKSAVSNWTGLFAAQIAVWISACISQITLYSSPLWSASKIETHRSVFLSNPRDSATSEVRASNQKANMYAIRTNVPTSPSVSLTSPTFSARSSQSLRCWTDSLQHVVRPVTSRTKLINRSSFNKDARSIYSDDHSIDNVSQVDGFDLWDTSSVDPRAREAVTQAVREAPSLSAKDAALQSAPSRGTALETIPGSRPASPARALNGPFPLSSDGRDSPALAPPPKMMPDTSRPSSPVVSESHIHPLFRTESPTPAPPTTLGTSIIASPLATQMIPCPPRPYSRMRSNSRTASPSPLLHSRSLYDGNNSPKRSPSPPSREMTPPIPDFVLNSSP